MHSMTIRDFFRDHFAQGWRQSPAFSRRSVIADLKAGFVVSMIAIPLAIAITVGMGMAPEHGMYTIVIGGFFAALTGGSRYQVTGTAAAFMTVLIPIFKELGPLGLSYTTFLAALLVLIYSFTGLGKTIRLVPFPVTSGYLGGLALVIFTLQLKDLLGLKIPTVPLLYWQRIKIIVYALPTVNLWESAVGLLTIAIIVFMNNRKSRFPSPVVALVIATTVVWALTHWGFVKYQFATLENRFVLKEAEHVIRGIPPGLPSFENWIAHFHNFDDFWYMTTRVFPAAITLSVLMCIESLMSSVACDALTQTKHDPTSELMGQGLANIIGSFFGSITSAGGIARSSTSIRFGAVSPLAAMFHSVVVAVILLFFTPYISKIPMAALAGLLVIVAFHMADIKRFKAVLRCGTREDRMVLVICFFAVVLVDMIAGVFVGVVLASLLFMGKMARVSQGHWLAEALPDTALLPGLQTYVFDGPMFFAAAQRAIASLFQVSNDTKVILLDLERVSFIDITALTALQSALLHIQENGAHCLICNANPEVEKKLAKFFSAYRVEQPPLVVKNRAQALEIAQVLLKSTSTSSC